MSTPLAAAKPQISCMDACPASARQQRHDGHQQAMEHVLHQTRVDVAVPRGARAPKVAAPVRWHHFVTATFDLGRDVLELDVGFTVGLYPPERSIVDAYRLRHLEGDELGREALKEWLRRRGSQPSKLLDVAASFPRAEGRLREDLRVLL